MDDKRPWRTKYRPEVEPPPIPVEAWVIAIIYIGAWIVAAIVLF